MAHGKIKADTLEHSTAGSLDTQYVVKGSAKVWLVQSQNTTINDSLNVSSLTDNAVGDCSFSFTSSMATTSHALLGVMQSGVNRANIMIIHGTMATGSGRCRFGNHNSSSSVNDITLFDDNNVKNATFGDLA